MLDEEHILWDVVEEHLDEAEFLVELWQSARASGLYTLAELAEGPEARLAAHVDGLVINGPLALERVAWPVVEDPGAEPNRVTAAALALLDGGEFRVLQLLDEPKPEPEPEAEPEAEEVDPEDEIPAGLDVVDPDVRALAAANPQEDPVAAEVAEADEAEGEAETSASTEAAREPSADPLADPTVQDDEPLDPRFEPLALALALSSHPQLGEQLRAHAAKAEGASLALVLRACADRGLHPGPGLDRGLAHGDPRVQRAALRAAAFAERGTLLAAVEARLLHRSASVRAAALDTAMRWGSRAAWEQALQAYEAPEAADARLWIACLGDDRHVQALVPLLEDEVLRNDVLWALGFSGRVPAVEACLSYLDAKDETTRRLAGEAVAAILGLDLEDETLWEQEPPEAAPSAAPKIEADAPEHDEDDLDAELAAKPEDELPLPIAAAIRERWATLEAAFVPGQRYLLGKPVEREGPGWALPLSSCRRVDVVAREVVARSQGIGRWPGRAPAPRHQQAAGALAELGRQAGAIAGDRR